MQAWSQELGTSVNETGLDLPSGSLQVCGRTTISKKNPKVMDYRCSRC